MSKAARPPLTPTADRRESRVEDLRERVREAALDATVLLPGVQAVALFGSLARAAPIRPSSDVDLLVLTTIAQSGRALRNELAHVIGRDVGLLIHTPFTLDRLRHQEWSFVEHLRREHLAISDPRGMLNEALRVRTPDNDYVRSEIRSYARALQYLDDVEVLSGQHLTSYSRLYAVAKSVVILDGLLAGEPEFDRSLAFDAWRHRHAHAAELANVAEELEPFYLRLRRRVRLGLPWTPRRDAERLRRVTSSVRQLIRESTR